METDDMISLPGSNNSIGGREINELCEAGGQASNNEVAADREDLGLNEEGTRGEPNLGVTSEGDTGKEEGEAEEEKNLVLNKGCDVGAEDDQTEVDMDLSDSPVMQLTIGGVADSVTVVNADNGYLDTRTESLHKIGGSYVSGVKRPRMRYDEQQPSVHVMYNSLTRASKRKLEQLLQQWSEWHAQHDSSSQDLNEVLESGEDTYFPALRFDLEKSSAVSFWIENQARKQQSDGFIPVDSNSVPLYDRGYAMGLTSADGPSNVEGGLEIVGDAVRCFNCGSYNHSLKECPKPRDNVAVNNARKQHKSKRNQNPGSRNPTRYYQNSSGGKYDGLKPGALNTETRQLLGLGELDPPPWLNRMRELGYPPGYLDEDDEDQPSGITIFADGDIKEEQGEDGEIIEKDCPEPQRKMTVEFPGINAPIPENADETLWEGPSSSDPFRNQSQHWSNRSPEPISRRHHHEQRRSRHFMDDGPPGVDSVFSPSMSSYPSRYGNYDYSYSSDSPRDLTPTIARSHSDRGRSTLVYEDFVSHSSIHSSSRKRSLQHEIGSARFSYETNDRRDDHAPDNSFRINDDGHRHRHRSWR